MTDFTVAIPTYNGAERLPLVLDKLGSQIVVEGLSWEAIVVDNNSNDDTAEVVKTYQKQWNYPFPLRYCFEPQQGLAFARQKAVTEAKGELIGFLDDDNLPEANWVAAGYKFGQSHPKVGAYGSKIVGDFEVTPPENFNRIATFLALIDRGKSAKLYDSKKKMFPPGAGLIVRKSVWLENVPAKLMLSGRVAGKMLASEDLEALRYIQGGGWEIWYNPEMVVHHLIPKGRLEKEYLMKLCYGIGLASYPTRTINLSLWQKPIFWGAYLVNDLRKILLHIFKYGKEVKNDPVVASEMQFFVGRLMSPFYFLGVVLRGDRSSKGS
jgi:glycosyltransferase involved in cell wall biosynthesis